MSAELSISEMLFYNEGRYCSPANRVMRSRKTGMHVIEVRSNVQSFTAPRCDFHRFNFQLSGRMTLINFDLAHQTKRKPGYLVPGSFAYIPRGTETVAQIDGDPFHILQVMIPRDQMRKALELVTGTQKNDDDLIGHIGSAGPAFLRIGQLLHHEYATVAKGSPEMMCSLSDMLCIELARTFGHVNSREKPDAAFSKTEEQRLIDMIGAVVDGVSRLADVAEALNLEPYQFTRRFRAHFDESPRKYVQRLRLAQVRDLLVRTTLALTDIAYSSGFSSQAHMTSAFSKHYGISPARYRKSMARSN